jgi:uncharacterized protein (UPF0548 family)
MQPRVRDDLPVSAQPMSDQRQAVLRLAKLTYPEVGMTQNSVLPVSYRTFQRSVTLPPSVDFESASGDLLAWAVQRRAGIRVSSSSDVAPDAVVDLRLGVGPLSVTAPCRVVYVVDEPGRCGYAYGTLPGHPEFGEESFMLTRNESGEIAFTVTAFSRPATALSKVAGPLGRRVQDLMTTRYLRTFM